MGPQLTHHFKDDWCVCVHPYCPSHCCVFVPGHPSLAETHPCSALLRPPCSLLPQTYYTPFWDFCCLFNPPLSPNFFFLELSFLYYFALTETRFSLKATTFLSPLWGKSGFISHAHICLGQEMKLMFHLTSQSCLQVI